MNIGVEAAGGYRKFAASQEPKEGHAACCPHKDIVMVVGITSN